MSRHGRYGQFIRFIFSGVDFVVLNVAYFASCFIVYHYSDSADFLDKRQWLIVNLSLLLVEFVSSGIHERRVVYADRVMLEALRATLIHAVIYCILISFFEITPEVIEWGAFYGILYIGITLWWLISRRIIKHYRTLGFNFRRIIIIGGGPTTSRLLEELTYDAGYGYRVIGIFDDDVSSIQLPQYDTENSPKRKVYPIHTGVLDEVEDFVNKNYVDEIYCTAGNERIIERIVKIADNCVADFYYVPIISSVVPRNFDLSSIGNIPVVSMRPIPLNNFFNRTIKRTVDLLISTVLIILSPIVFIPVAIGIKLSSPGPIFFKQLRTGYRGKDFWCYKFRTMRVNDQSNTLQATRDDPRKTRLGNILRRTSIDELPQIFNVWLGNMSLVGPRPHMLELTKEYSSLIDKYMIRHTVKPGITGWAQTHGCRGSTEQLWQMEKRVELDIWYAQNWNLMLDVKIVLLTIVDLIRGDENAF